MYLRHSTVKKNGKVHTYWRLVRSVRAGGKVRQQTVAHLGELDAKGRAKASALLKYFLGDRANQLDLFEDRRLLEIAPVKLGDVRVERGRIFGDVWLAFILWKILHLDEFCAKIMEAGRQKISFDVMAFVLVAARLCEPSSELHIAEDWYRRTALEDLLRIDAAAVHHTRLYQALDKLLPHKPALEKHLKDRLGNLFNLDYDLLLYDVTSTYFVSVTVVVLAFMLMFPYDILRTQIRRIVFAIIHCWSARRMRTRTRLPAVQSAQSRHPDSAEAGHRPRYARPG